MVVYCEHLERGRIMATKDEIKGSAYYCFAHYGYEGTTMQDIAKAVGLKKQSLYSHFESKEELYLLVLQEQQLQIFAEMRQAYEQFKNESAEDLLKGLFGSIVSMFTDRERLLLWKRMFIYYGSGTNVLISDTTEWHFDKRLKDMLYKALNERYPALADYSAFESFFISYMLMIQGYLDWMITMGHDRASWQAVWMSFWNGVKSLFLF